MNWASIVLAQAASEELASGGFETFTTIYLIGGGFVVMGLVWALGQLGRFLSEKSKEQKWFGVLYRLNIAITDAVEGSHAAVKAKMQAARDKTSPGGEKITADERDEIKKAAWEYLKNTYGSFEGLAKVAGSLVGGDVEKFVDGKIDAAIENKAAEDANPK